MRKAAKQHFLSTFQVFQLDGALTWTHFSDYTETTWMLCYSRHFDLSQQELHRWNTFCQAWLSSWRCHSNPWQWAGTRDYTTLKAAQLNGTQSLLWCDQLHVCFLLLWYPKIPAEKKSLFLTPHSMKKKQKNTGVTNSNNDGCSIQVCQYVIALWQWASMHNTWSFTPIQLHGIEPPLI